jgi:hypothetical protein
MQRSAQYPLQPPIAALKNPSVIPPAPSRIAVNLSQTPKKPFLHADRRRSRSYDHLPTAALVAAAQSPSQDDTPSTQAAKSRPASRDRSVSTAAGSASEQRSSTSATAAVESVLTPDDSPRELAPVLEISSPFENLAAAPRPKSINWSSLPVKRVSNVAVNPLAVNDMKHRGTPNLESLGIKYEGASQDSVLFAQTASACVCFHSSLRASPANQIFTLRSTLSSISQHVLSTGSIELDVPPAAISTHPLPSWFPKDDFSIVLRTSIANFGDKEVFCKVTDNTTSLLKRVLPGQGNAVLKISGLQEYVFDLSLPLCNLAYVRQCLKEKSVPEFSILTKTTTLSDAFDAIPKTKAAILDCSWIESPLVRANVCGCFSDF